MADAEKIRVTVEEFLAMPEPSGIVELIDGEIVETVVKNTHQKLARAVFRALDKLGLSGELFFAPLRVFFGEHILEPDVLWISSENQRCFLGDDDYWHGAPDLVVEVISPSSKHKDRKRKYQIYEQHGVREYWIIDPDDEEIQAYELRDGRFVRIAFVNRTEKFFSPVLGHEITFDSIFADLTTK